MRINRNNTQDGYATSVSVTPYNPDFYSWIEPGIQPVVRALVDKGYYPLSSCEGHGPWDNANVVIAFPDIVAAFDFMELLEPLESAGIKTNYIYPEDYMEKTEPLVEAYKDIPKLRKKGVRLRKLMTERECYDCLNMLYRRGSRAWMLVEVTVSEGWDKVNPISAMWNHWVAKKDNIELLTDLIDRSIPFMEA